MWYYSKGGSAEALQKVSLKFYNMPKKNTMSIVIMH